jgi:hypothetical protein
MSRRKFTQIISTLSLALRGRPVLSVSRSEGFEVPPGFTVKWDMNAEDTRISAEFQVRKYRYYDILILFEGHAGDAREMFKYAGDGTLVLVARESANNDNPSVIIATTAEEARSRDAGIAAGKYVWILKHTGVMIPVHVRIEKLPLAAGDAAEVDRDFRTWSVQGSFAGLSRASPGGLARPVTSAKLRPGNYRITAKTLARISLPPGSNTHLLVTYRPNTRVLRENE